MITLVLEAATYAGSTALLDGSRLVGERSVAMRGREREALMPAVADLLAEQGIPVRGVGRVVCGAGPGSFTSLRIAGGIAKGIAMAVGVPLVPVSSLALLVASQSPMASGRCLGAIDALRGEHYVALFDVESGDAVSVTPVGPTTLIASTEVERFAADLNARVIGFGGTTSGATEPRARAAALLTKLIDATAPADLAGWEPAYGRLAEAQVKWEAAHGRPMTSA